MLYEMGPKGEDPKDSLNSARQSNPQFPNYLKNIFVQFHADYTLKNKRCP